LCNRGHKEKCSLPKSASASSGTVACRTTPRLVRCRSVNVFAGYNAGVARRF
jgi:hypothetical protein